MGIKKLVPTSGTKVVAAAATAEVLSATSIRVRKIYLQSKLANAAELVIGSSKALAEAGSGYVLSAAGDAVLLDGGAGAEASPGDFVIDLADLWIKVGTNGDEVIFLYFT